MPQGLVDFVAAIWNFIKRFARDLYTLVKFRGREFDERLRVKYSNMVRALIWLGIVFSTLGIILFILSFTSSFLFNLIDWANRTPPEPTPTVAPPN